MFNLTWFVVLGSQPWVALHKYSKSTTLSVSSLLAYTGSHHTINRAHEHVQLLWSMPHSEKVWQGKFGEFSTINSPNFLLPNAQKESIFQIFPLYGNTHSWLLLLCLRASLAQFKLMPYLTPQGTVELPNLLKYQYLLMHAYSHLNSLNVTRFAKTRHNGAFWKSRFLHQWVLYI